MSKRTAYLRPGFTLRRIFNPLVQATGAAATLAVRGRKSGDWRTVSVNVLDHDGKRYLVVPRGNTEWVRNLRAAGGGEIRRRGNVERFRAEEVPVERRQPLIDAYKKRWGWQVGSQFKALPEPADHPSFEIRAD